MKNRLMVARDRDWRGYEIWVIIKGFPGGSEVKASACNAGDLGWIPW